MTINRRQFLAQTTAWAGTAHAQGRDFALPPAIDTHTHFYDPTRPQGVPWPPRSESLLYRPYLPAQFGKLTAAHGVLGTVVVEASPWVEDNQWLLDLARNNPMIVGFIGNLEPGKPEFAANLRRFSANPLFRGLRFGERVVAQGLGQTAFENDLRRLGEQQLTLDLLGGPALLNQVPRLAKLAPGLRLVLDHLPYNLWDQDVAALRLALREVAALPQVYAKVSNVARRVGERVVTEPEYYQPGLTALWELFGPDRLVYGSNWPVSERVAPYAVVHQIVAAYFKTKDLAAAEKFFWRNSLAAYRWQARGHAGKLVK